MDCEYCNPFLVSTLFSDDDVEVVISEGNEVTVDVNRPSPFYFHPYGIYAKTFKVD